MRSILVRILTKITACKPACWRMECNLALSRENRSPKFFLEYIMNMVLASIGTACIAVALGQLIPEGMWIWLAALAYGCCTLTLAFVWND